MYNEYLTKETLEEFGNFQLGQVIRVWGMVNYMYLLKGKEREGYKWRGDKEEDVSSYWMIVKER
jgi:predicted Zn-dependent protease